MMRYHYFLWFFVISLCTNALAAEGGRYSNYAFEPVYPVTDLAEKTEKLILAKVKLLEWHELQRLEVLEVKPR